MNIPNGFRRMAPDEVMVNERDYFWGGYGTAGSDNLRDWTMVLGYGGSLVSRLLTPGIAITPIIAPPPTEKEWMNPWD